MAKKKYLPFKAAKAKAKEAVERLRDYMVAAGADCLVLHTEHNGYDSIYRVKQVQFSIELKCEVKQAHTGNLFFEVSQGFWTKASGVFTSTADITIHELPDAYWVFNTRILKMDIGYLAERNMSIVSGGDNNARGVLRPKAMLRDYPYMCLCVAKPDVLGACMGLLASRHPLLEKVVG